MMLDLVAPRTFFFSLSLLKKRFGVWKNLLTIAFSLATSLYDYSVENTPFMLVSDLWCSLLCSAVTFLLHATKRRMCKSKAVQQRMGPETFVEHLQLSPLASLGRRWAQHMLSTNHSSCFFPLISLFSGVL